MKLATLELGEPLQTREEYVTSKLRKSILTGHLRPGQRLEQNELAKALNVSRSPVREAIRTLAAEGLVEIIPHRGAVVAELSLEEIEEIYLLRKVLEGIATRSAVPNIDDERIANMSAILDELDQTEDTTVWLELNEKFHNTIYEASKRPRLLSMSENLRNTAAPYIQSYIALPENRIEAQIGHRRILQACSNRNISAAQKATEEHLDETFRGLVKALKQVNPGS